MTDVKAETDAAIVSRSPEELYEQARRWIADARACCKDTAAIEAWKREMQDWGYDMSPSARDYRLAGAARAATARRRAFDAMLRAKR